MPKQREGTLSSVQVRQAVQAAPGLSNASEAQIVELERLLVSGTCAPIALEKVFGGTNRQTLASLIRDLGRC